jgi:hypothetical protein
MVDSVAFFCQLKKLKDIVDFGGSEFALARDTEKVVNASMTIRRDCLRTRSMPSEKLMKIPIFVKLT